MAERGPAAGGRALDIAAATALLLLCVNFCLPVMLVINRTLRLGVVLAALVTFYGALFLRNKALFFRIAGITALALVFCVFFYFAERVDHGPFHAQVYALFVFWVPFVMMFYLLAVNDRRLYRAVAGVILAALAATGVTTVSGLARYPEAARLLATGRTDTYDLVYYRWLNIGDYGFIYALVLAVPLLVFLLRRGGRARPLYLALLGLFLTCIFMSQYTFATLMTLLSLSLLLTRKVHLVLGAAALAMIAALVFLRPETVYLLRGLESLLTGAGMDFFGEKFGFIARYLETGGAVDDSGRVHLYLDSLRAFAGNPFFGVTRLPAAPFQPGGHSSLLDTLGYLGLVGLGFAACFIMLYRQAVRERFRGRTAYFYLRYVGLLALAISLLNTVFYSATVTVVFCLAAVAIAGGFEAAPRGGGERSCG